MGCRGGGPADGMVVVKLGVSCHRRYTANHTWHVDLGRHAYFLKANPSRNDAEAERRGYKAVREYYPVPRLRGWCRLPGWSLHLYERWPRSSVGKALLLDVIARAESTRCYTKLNACMSELIAQYRKVISATTRVVPNSATCAKLYGDRAERGGRLDAYYGDEAPWQGLWKEVRPRTRSACDAILVNGRKYELDWPQVVESLRAHFEPAKLVHAAITQGDPTDFNLGWNSEEGPVWFDFDTGGLNALAGEFACFLMYQRLHGAWLTPRYNSAAYEVHRAGQGTLACTESPVVRTRLGSELCIDYAFAPSPARRLVMARYVQELVAPIAEELSVGNLVAWLRPYFAMRILAVYKLISLQPSDLALCTALLAKLMSPDASLAKLLGLDEVDAQERSAMCRDLQLS